MAAQRVSLLAAVSCAEVACCFSSSSCWLGCIVKQQHPQRCVPRSTGCSMYRLLLLQGLQLLARSGSLLALGLCEMCYNALWNAHATRGSGAASWWLLVRMNYMRLHCRHMAGTFCLLC
jgi:hypothetical protein